MSGRVVERMYTPGAVKERKTEVNCLRSAPGQERADHPALYSLVKSIYGYVAGPCISEHSPAHPFTLLLLYDRDVSLQGQAGNRAGSCSPALGRRHRGIKGSHHPYPLQQRNETDRTSTPRRRLYGEHVGISGLGGSTLGTFFRAAQQTRLLCIQISDFLNCSNF